MGIGNKIKELRIENGMAQKDLADYLHVTYQAVSRWENDEVEPSIDTIKQMAARFDCSIDTLFNEDDDKEEAVEEVKQVDVQNTYPNKPVLGVCRRCKEPIFDKDDLHFHRTTHHHARGRTTHNEYIVCSKCEAVIQAEERKAAEIAKKSNQEAARKKRRKAFILPIFLTIPTLIFVVANPLFGIVFAYAIYAVQACLILDNNCVSDVVLSVATFSIKLPGIIFSLDLDGFIVFLAFKIVVAILSFFLGILMAIAGFLIGAVVSIFVYPSALKKSKYDCTH